MTALLRDCGSLTVSGSSEISKLKAQLEKARKENEDLKERLFTGSYDDTATGSAGAGEEAGRGKNLVRAQRDLVRE